MNTQELISSIKSAAAAIVAGSTPAAAMASAGLAPSADAHRECLALVKAGGVPPAALDLLEALRPVVARSTAPLSKDEFLAKAKTIVAKSGPLTFTLDPREFAKGSFGWGEYGKFDVPLGDGTSIKCQCSLTLTVVGSKPASAE